MAPRRRLFLRDIANPRRRAMLRHRLRARLGRNRGRIGKIMQPVQYFKRTAYYTNWLVSNTGIDMVKNLEFYLNAVPNHSEFTNLYDQYKITKVVAQLIPKFNSSDPINLQSIAVPPTWSILDYDGTFPTNETGFLQYQNLKMIPGTAWHKRVLVPKFLSQAYNGLTTAYQPKTGFLDTANDNVPHYGVACLLKSTGGNATYGYDLKVTYYLAFKNVR